MKKIIALSFLAFQMAMAAVNAQDIKLDDVLNAYYKATGIAMMKDWTSIRVNGTTIEDGIEYPFTRIQKRPLKLREETDTQGNKTISSFDGKQGWMVDPRFGTSAPEDMTADQMKEMKEQADMEGALYHWQEKGHLAEFLGKDEMEGTSVYKIKITKASGNIETYFIDSESFILLKTSSKVKIDGNDLESDTFYSDYKEVSGVQIPNYVLNRQGENTASQIVIDNIEINPVISDSLFEKPVVKIKP